MRLIGWALAALAVLWAAALPLAAYAASQPEAGSPASYFALAVYAVGSVICHQRPERSFHLWAAQLPVCARCAGIYAGAAFGGIAAIAWTESGPAAARQRQAPTSWTARIALLLAALPAIVSLAYEWTTGHTPSNTIRALTGVLVGVVGAWLVVRQTLR